MTDAFRIARNPDPESTLWSTSKNATLGCRKRTDRPS